MLWQLLQWFSGLLHVDLIIRMKTVQLQKTARKIRQPQAVMLQRVFHLIRVNLKML